MNPQVTSASKHSIFCGNWNCPKSNGSDCVNSDSDSVFSFHTFKHVYISVYLSRSYELGKPCSRRLRTLPMAAMVGWDRDWSLRVSSSLGISWNSRNSLPFLAASLRTETIKHCVSDYSLINVYEFSNITPSKAQIKSDFLSYSLSPCLWCTYCMAEDLKNPFDIFNIFHNHHVIHSLPFKSSGQ